MLSVEGTASLSSGGDSKKKSSSSVVQILAIVPLHEQLPVEYHSGGDGSNSTSSSSSASVQARAAIVTGDFAVTEVTVYGGTFAQSEWHTRHQFLAKCAVEAGLDASNAKSKNGNKKSFSVSPLHRFEVTRWCPGTLPHEDVSTWTVRQVVVADNLTTVALLETPDRRRHVLLMQPRFTGSKTGAAGESVRCHVNAFTTTLSPLLGGSGSGDVGISLNAHGSQLMIYLGKGVSIYSTEQLPTSGLSCGGHIGNTSTTSTAAVDIIVASFLPRNAIAEYVMVTSDGSIRLHLNEAAAEAFNINPNPITGGGRGTSTSTSTTGRRRHVDPSSGGRASNVDTSTAAATAAGGGGGSGEGLLRSDPTVIIDDQHNASSQEASKPKSSRGGVVTGSRQQQSQQHRVVKVHSPELQEVLASQGSGSAIINSISHDGSMLLLVFPSQRVAFLIHLGAMVVSGIAPGDVIVKMNDGHFTASSLCAEGSCLSSSHGRSSWGDILQVAPDRAVGFLLMTKSASSSTTTTGGAENVKAASGGGGGGATTAGGPSVPSMYCYFLSASAEVRPVGFLPSFSPAEVSSTAPSVLVGTTNNHGQGILAVSGDGSTVAVLGFKNSLTSTDTVLWSRTALEALVRHDIAIARRGGTDGSGDETETSRRMVQRIIAAFNLEATLGFRRSFSVSSTTTSGGGGGGTSAAVGGGGGSASIGGGADPTVPSAPFQRIGGPLAVLHSVLGNALSALHTALVEAVEFSTTVDAARDALLPPEDEEERVLDREECLRIRIHVLTSALVAIATLPLPRTFEEKSLFLPIITYLIQQEAWTVAWKVVQSLGMPHLADLLYPAVAHIPQLGEEVYSHTSSVAQGIVTTATKVLHRMQTEEAKPSQMKPKSAEAIETCLKDGDVMKLTLLDGYEIGYHTLATKGPAAAAAVLDEHFTRRPGCDDHLVDMQKRMVETAQTMPHAVV